VDALRFSFAEIAFEGLFLLRVKPDGLERTCLFAGSAACANLFPNQDRSGMGFDLDGGFRAGFGTGDIGALVADRGDKRAFEGVRPDVDAGPFKVHRAFMGQRADDLAGPAPCADLWVCRKGFSLPKSDLGKFLSGFLSSHPVAFSLHSSYSSGITALAFR
jgi:hypothetical protein